LTIFRASDTIEAVRSIHRDLANTGVQAAVGALMLDEANSDDLLIAEADPKKLFNALLEKEQASGADWLSGEQKRSRLTSPQHGQLALIPHPGEAQMGMTGYGEAAPFRPNGATTADMASVEDLLKAPTAKQRQLIDAGDELRQLLAEPTAKQSLTASKFMNKSRNMAQFCPHGSRNDCRRAMESVAACARIHFKKIIKPWTDESLGDCSYLDTCRHIDKCKYVHYALDLTVEQAKYLNECGVHNRGTDTKRINEMELGMKGADLPAQWVQCDLRRFPLTIFNGQIDVVMADPPWDIHMELPYGTLTDDEVRNLKIGDIHKDGVIFLWVTGRAMELARDCFRIWGYKRIEEIIWVKTNQLQRIIRTGRTGHWINHSKEHCLVGIKGNPRLNRNLDCDVIVSEVRETSRKPDEIYNLIERMFPNCMKLELFGRPHNVHDNWITCGNQLDGVRLCDEEIVRRYNVENPDAKTNVWTRDKEAVIPVSMNGGSSGQPGGISSEDAPWIPPRSAPPPMQSPFPNAPPQPSTSEAWLPPSAPPSGVSKDDRPAPQTSTSYPASYPPAWPPGSMPPPGYCPPPGYGPWGPYRR
jgi:N6-adenosine-specific RNA methylase IME4